MTEESPTLEDRVTDLVRLAPLLVAFFFFAVAVMRAMNLGVATAIETLLVGWLLVFPPLAAIVWTLVGRPAFVPWPSDWSRERAADRDPLAVARDRYARGELSETEFEDRVGRLLETEPGDRTRGPGEREPVVERE